MSSKDKGLGLRLNYRGGGWISMVAVLPKIPSIP